MTRLAVMASGGGTTLQSLLDAFPGGSGTGASQGRDGATVAALAVNTPGAPALERGRRAGVPSALIAHRGRSRQAFEADLTGFIEGHQADLVCLAGFLRILSPAFIARFAGRILNVHPALLPAFGGMGMYGERVHRAVLDAGAAISGCTIHLVDENPDGGPIVAQVAVPVLPGDTPETLGARVLTVEHEIYPQALRMIATEYTLL